MPQEECGPGRHQPTEGRKPATYTNYKQEMWHNPEKFFESEKNAAQCLSEQTTRLWRCGLENSVVKHIRPQLNL